MKYFDIKVDDWKLEDGLYKTHIKFDNPNDEDLVVSLVVDTDEEFEKLSNIISDYGSVNSTECVLAANSLIDYDIKVGVDFLSNMPGHVETIEDENGNKSRKYVE